MDKQIKTEWLKALRSGRYKQGNFALVNEQGEYCCLGVLARVQGAEKKEIMGSCFLENAFAKYNAGLKIRSQHTLAKFNDSDGKTFKEIADYIEKHYK